MDSSQITQGFVNEKYTKTGKVSGFQVEIRHKGLKDYKLITATDLDILENKIRSQKYKWNEKWRQIVENKRLADELNASQEEANRSTGDATKKLKEIDALLIHTLSINDAVNWEDLKDKSSFEKMEFKPEYEKEERINYSIFRKPTDVKLYDIPHKPDRSSTRYQIQLSLWDKMSSSRKAKKENEANERYESDVRSWEAKKTKIESDNTKRGERFNLLVAEWNEAKNKFEEKQNATNKKIDELKQKYQEQTPDAIIEYCELVLNNSEYPETFSENFEIEYNDKTKILVVEYSLPPIENFPTLKEVKFIKAKNELKEYHISHAQLLQMFDPAMYKITLRTLHELFEADVINAIDAISFNGWINSINKATGKRENTCILSIQVKKDEFLDVDLQHVDPKACFKNFKGVGSSKLSGLTPVQPILQIDKTDKRFVSSYDVADTLDTTSNLAAMDWEDFEHLIREVFAKEFSSSGGEVKVTQASSDGGVDAVAFDPDPIRGGKIVIQAKRYTNTVGVSAVRDLYGTVMNEGATKGILVTTADYGPDAYKFAKGKPITI
jgi:restriction system protein